MTKINIMISSRNSDIKSQNSDVKSHCVDESLIPTISSFLFTFIIMA